MKKIEDYKRIFKEYKNKKLSSWTFWLCVFICLYFSFYLDSSEVNFFSNKIIPLFISLLNKIDGFIGVKIKNTFTTILFTAVTTAFFTYKFTFKKYLAQQKSERIRKLYIEDGVEKAIETADQLSTSCLFNYSKAKLVFEILKNSVNSPEKRKKIITRILSEEEEVVVMPNFSLAKLMLLFDSGSLVALTSYMFMELQQCNQSIIPAMIQITDDYFDVQKNMGMSERLKFIEEQEEHLWNKFENISLVKFKNLQASLLALQMEMSEISLLCISDLYKIKNNKQIISVIKKVEIEYSEVLKKLGEDRD